MMPKARPPGRRRPPPRGGSALLLARAAIELNNKALAKLACLALRQRGLPDRQGVAAFTGVMRLVWSVDDERLQDNIS